MQTDDLTVRVQTLDDGWQTLGSDRFRGISVEDCSLTSNQYGSDTATFTLKRSDYYSSPDLISFTPVEVEIAGQVVWSGRVLETPSQGPTGGLAVTAQGWQYHLDDNPFMRTYVHAKTDDFIDVRSVVTADLTVMRQAGQVSNDGGIVLGVPSGTAVAANTGVGAVLDLGQSDGLVVTSLVDIQAGGGLTADLYCIGTDVPYWNDPSSRADFYHVTGVANSTGAIPGGVAAARKRYVTFLLWFTATATSTAEFWVKIRGANIYRQTAYQASNASVLTAPAVLKDLVSMEGSISPPSLSADTSLIDPNNTVTFKMPELDFGKNPQTYRQVIDAVNAFHNYQTYVDVKQRLGFRPRPTVPLFVVGAWPGSEFHDTSLNDGSEIYDGCMITGTDVAGNFFSTTYGSSAGLVFGGTQAYPLTMRWGFGRTKQIDIQAALTQAAADQLATTFLAASAFTPFKGDLVVEQGGCRTISGSATVHPSMLLRNTGELVRIADHVDPTTGALGRDGRIDTVTYSHKDRKAQVSLDNSRKNFDAYLARLQALTANLPR